MATKNRIAYALPIIQIMWRLLAKSPIQNCLRLVYGERVGVVRTGYEVPKNPVFMRVYGHFPNWRIGFATLLQHVMSREPFATDEITANGYAVMS